MSKISIKLNEDYKSFKKGFECELEGDLIVLTGVNGSGKSQLLEVIWGKLFIDDQKFRISSVIKQNNVEISKEDIILKSFKQVISLKPISKAAIMSMKNIKDDVAQGLNIKQFKNDLKKHLKINNGKFDVELMANKLILDKMGSMWLKHIVETSPGILPFPHELKLIDFFDTFFDAQNLTDVFLTHLDHTNAKQKLRSKPWTILNQLFSKFNFDYKFADDYNELSNFGILKGDLYKSYKNEEELPNGVKLLDKNNDPLPFGIESLSDGEKAIFSLVIASMKAEINAVLPKILLLDEYDATFNPSLTETFYYILEEFFVKKGVTVILTTHNPTTVVFAPKSDDYKTTFYEINKPNSGKDRIEKKDWGEIEEAKMVLRKFYPQVGEYEKEIEELRKQNLPILFVEGKTDKIILENAWAKLYPNEKMPVYIPERSDGHNAKQLQFELEKADVFYKDILFGLFDFDYEGFSCWNSIKEWKTLNTPVEKCLTRKHKSKNYYALLLPLNITNENIKKQCVDSNGKHFGNKTVFSIEHLFYGVSDELNKKFVEEEVSGGGKVIHFRKDKTTFAESTKTFVQEDFKNFIPIFDTIREILKVN